MELDSGINSSRAQEFWVGDIRLSIISAQLVFKTQESMKLAGEGVYRDGREAGSWQNYRVINV